MESTSADQPDVEAIKPPRRLAGSFNTAEQEDSARQRRRGRRARDRQFRSMRLKIVAGVLVVSAIGAVLWRDLSRKYFEASEPLKYISIQYELQKMEIMRYAPFHERHERQASRELDRAMGEMASNDLRARVKALETVRTILRPRVSKAVNKLKRDYPQMRETFEMSLEDSDATVKELRAKYAETAKAYNATAASLPGMLLQQVAGYPDKLPQLKN